MELLLTEDQRLLQDGVAKMLAQGGGVKRTRELRNSPSGFDRDMYVRMASEGWFSLLVPQDFEGLGLGLTEFGLVMQEAGRVLAPEPIAAAAACAAVLAGVGKSDAAAALLEKVMAGDVLVMPAAGSGNVTIDLRSGQLSGAFDGIAMAGSADGFLVEASTGNEARLAYVQRNASGLTVFERGTVDGRSFGRLTFENAAAEFVVDAPSAAQRLYDLLLFGAAAELVGVMTAALDMTVEYLKTRKQFGKPIGSFQALQHRAADDFASIVSARSFVFQVAGQPTQLSSGIASALKAHCGSVALEVTKSAIQMHGAIGFTDEYDVGLYLKRAMWVSAWLGNEAEQRQRFMREHAEA